MLQRGDIDAQKAAIREKMDQIPPAGGGRRERMRRRRFRVAALLCAGLILFLVLNSHLQPLIASYGLTQAKLVGTQAVNDAVTAVLEREGVRYTDLMRVEKDSQGSIVSVEADTVKINALKASVTTEILTQLKKHQNMTVRIPTGTLLNGDLLTGRGPRIPVKISLSGAAATQMSSYFESAGINQTSHRLVMDITVTLYAAIPGNDATTTLETSFIIAETVLVGKVPDTFLDVDGRVANLEGEKGNKEEE